MIQGKRRAAGAGAGGKGGGGGLVGEEEHVEEDDDEDLAGVVAAVRDVAVHEVRDAGPRLPVLLEDPQEVRQLPVRVPADDQPPVLLRRHLPPPRPAPGPTRAVSGVRAHGRPGTLL